jgi:hypothetical protein
MGKISDHNGLSDRLVSRRTVGYADELATAVMQRLTESFANERSVLKSSGTWLNPTSNLFPEVTPQKAGTVVP